MFITNNHALFHLWSKESFVKYQKVSKYYVHDCSKFLLNLAYRLDRQAGDYLSTESSEWVFFDGSHKRSKGFKMIAVAFYHPLVRKTVKILTIDVKSETTEGFVVMWELLNECLQKLTENKNHKFNPTGWMADENGANCNGIEKVFGKDSLSRVVSRKFNFLQARNNTHQNKILNDTD